MNKAQDRVIVAKDDLVIRRMIDDESEYRLIVEWRNRPHVRRFWDPDDPPMTLSDAIEELRPDTMPEAVSRACIIELDGAPVGFIQFYEWKHYEEDARSVGLTFDENSYSLDLFIGEEDVTGRGFGTKAVALLSDHLLNELGASSVELLTEVDNHVAIRCYEKAGFRKVQQVLDTDTYKGERVKSWLMAKRPGREDA